MVLVLVTSVGIAVLLVVAAVLVDAFWTNEDIKVQVLGWGGLIAVVGVWFIVSGGYLLGWKWTGFPHQTLWDWLKLLVVPAADLAIKCGLWRLLGESGPGPTEKPGSGTDRSTVVTRCHRLTAF